MPRCWSGRQGLGGQACTCAWRTHGVRAPSMRARRHAPAAAAAPLGGPPPPPSPPHCHPQTWQQRAAVACTRRPLVLKPGARAAGAGRRCSLLPMLLLAVQSLLQLAGGCEKHHQHFCCSGSCAVPWAHWQPCRVFHCRGQRQWRFVQGPGTNHPKCWLQLVSRHASFPSPLPPAQARSHVRQHGAGVLAGWRGGRRGAGGGAARGCARGLPAGARVRGCWGRGAGGAGSHAQPRPGQAACCACCPLMPRPPPALLLARRSKASSSRT